METQNLKTRIRKILCDCPYNTDPDNGEIVPEHSEVCTGWNMDDAIYELLSSELSLVVKELREAVENMEYCPTCDDKPDEKAHDKGWLHAHSEALSAFDIKYKELQEKV